MHCIIFVVEKCDVSPFSTFEVSNIGKLTILFWLDVAFYPYVVLIHLLRNRKQRYTLNSFEINVLIILCQMWIMWLKLFNCTVSIVDMKACNCSFMFANRTLFDHRPNHMVHWELKSRSVHSAPQGLPLDLVVFVSLSSTLTLCKNLRPRELKVLLLMKPAVHSSRRHYFKQVFKFLQ